MLIKFTCRIGGRTIYVPSDKISAIVLSGPTVEIIVDGVRYEVINNYDYIREQITMSNMPRLIRKFYKFLKKVAENK